mmetsp:Transcript_21816/g.35050  ORF Transcript_21816/g.35050 Transcript_21816/m.35050 type:complete len:332 (-) Transcript_21816:931-1926(-)|eukprot:CAMPEP_0202688796 /NCGR_PEP_ID=MMETSP1385-20130828/4224_1 /ASSEMBLY_ACC=CAM_ASM_000861 /TAXON_ID=933848 /ORGANISM="Elphidium margaritaceum" /LENGTH=331 /DNA_ID=CAMNT_0049343837 /DNA_START=39 /DNA_END=1034 /DNA_ORIENTATION=+
MSVVILFTSVVTICNAILPENEALIERLNGEHSTAKFAPNQFENISIAEFRATRLIHLDPTQMLRDLSSKTQHIPAVSDIPSSFDWRDYNVVTGVKNQYSCGTCWAFSTTGNIEGQWALYNNQSHALTSLSEEFLVDCDSNDCGMFGGWPYLAYEYVIAEKGIPSEASYPYCCGTRDTCYPCMAAHYNRTMCGDHSSLYCNATWNDGHCPRNDWQIASSITDWMSISQNETEIAKSLVELGPLSVLMNAESLSHYRSGIYDPSRCDPTDLDHGVLLVGYGTENGVDYWIVKNSWDSSWGESGYFRIVRGVGKCGINTAVTTSCIGVCKTNQ